MKLAWAVQTNLNENTAARFDRACRATDLEFIPFNSIPFSDDISGIPTDRPVMVYGSTRIVKLVEDQCRVNPGVLPITPAWQWYWNRYCLNNTFITCTLGDFHKYYPKLEGENYFIRPMSDYKEFAGEVWDVEEFRNHIVSLDEEMMPLRIQISEVKRIYEEYRLFIVDGQVSTGSLYRRSIYTDLDPYIPSNILRFAEDRIQGYNPQYVYVMDLCTVMDYDPREGPIRIIEINGFNSCSFYESDVTKFVKDVSDFYGRISK